jgi:voltage-gated potassium channel
MNLRSIRKRVHEIVEPAGEGDGASRAFDVGILALILLNVVAIVLHSFAELREEYGGWFWWFEVVSVVVFTLEYVLRVWSCVELAEYSEPVAGRIRYTGSFMPMVDVLAVLPFYLPFTGVDLRFIRVVRLMRLFRILKLGRYSKAMRVMGRVVSSRRGELGVTLFVLCLLLVLASTVMYYAEYEAQPDAFPHIPAAMWWAAAALTTVGYGDVYPVTGVGKLMGAVIAILGIGMFALPTGILGAGFMEEHQKGLEHARESGLCPHCGKRLNDTE